MFCLQPVWITVGMRREGLLPAIGFLQTVTAVADMQLVVLAAGERNIYELEEIPTC